MMKIQNLFSIAAVSLIATSSLHGQEPLPTPDAEAQARAERAEGLYSRAKNLHDTAEASADLDSRANYFSKAHDLFDVFIHDYPNHPLITQAYFYSARSQYFSGNVEDAKRTFAQLLKRQGKNQYIAEAAKLLGNEAFQKKDYNTAGVIFRKLAECAVKPEERLQGLYMQAICFDYRSKSAEALAAYQALLAEPAVAVSPYLQNSQSRVGSLLRKSGKLKEALEFFQQIIASPGLEKNRANATYNAGITAYQMQDTQSAENFFRSILSNKAKEWLDFQDSSLSYMILMLFQKKQYAEVIQFYQSHPPVGDMSDPNNPNTSELIEGHAFRTYIAAESMKYMGRYIDALPLYLDVVKIAPESERAYEASYSRLLCFYKVDGGHIADQVDAFLEIYGKNKRTHPHVHQANMMKAGALQNSGKLKEAAEAYNRIDATLISESNRANLLYNRAYCLLQSEDPAGAARSLEQFIKDYTSDKRTPDAILMLGDARLASGDKAGAITEYTKLRDLNAGEKLTAQAMQKIARAKKLNNDFAGSVEAYKEFLAKFKNLPRESIANAEFSIGLGYFKLEKMKDAIPHLNKAREIDEQTYGKQVGILLTQCYLSEEQVENLATELDKAIDKGYSDQVPAGTLIWAGGQALSLKKGEQAARFLYLVSTPDEPRRTSRDVWRKLGKALILIKDYKAALKPIKNVLDIEDQPLAKADALLDQARCYFGLKQYADAHSSLEAALELRPQGALEARATILLGDVYMAQDKADKAQEALAATVTLLNDDTLRPLAISKLIKALEKQSKQDLVDKYKLELSNKYPNWKPEE